MAIVLTRLGALHVAPWSSDEAIMLQVCWTSGWRSFQTTWITPCGLTSRPVKASNVSKGREATTMCSGSASGPRAKSLSVIAAILITSGSSLLASPGSQPLSASSQSFGDPTVCQDW